MSRSLTLGMLTTHFETKGVIRLMGPNASNYVSDLQTLLFTKFLRLNVVKGDIECHHSFNADVSFVDVQVSKDSNISLIIKEHFNKNPTQMAIYVVITPTCELRSTRIVASGTGWVAVRFCEEEPKDAFTIAESVSDAVSHVFNRPLLFRPRVSIRDRNVKIALFSAKNDTKSKGIIESSMRNGISVNVTVFPYDLKAFNMLCSFCEDVQCVSSWIRNVPQFFESIKSGFLPVFILSDECPNDFVYGDQFLTIAPIDNEQGLTKAIRGSLYGTDTIADLDPFIEILANRNMAVYPLVDIVSSLSSILQEILEYYRLGVDFSDQRGLNRIDEMYSNFTSKQREFTALIMDGKTISNEYNELIEISAQIHELWWSMNDKVKKKRMCVGNMIDISQNPSIFTRPSFYFAIALVAGSAMVAYVFTRMRPKQVFRIIQSPSPLL